MKLKLSFIFIAAALVLSGCSSNLIVRDCKTIEGTNGKVCKSTYPWTDLDEEE